MTGIVDAAQVQRTRGLDQSTDGDFMLDTVDLPGRDVPALAARALLAKGLPLKAIAGKVGLRTSARLGQAFERRFGMAPSLFREMHASQST
ncbi:MAG: hypothetical protein K9G48_09715 [Reyranella sp.]|nr:hypothetical protein [Reyranella sp.]